ncbi:fimbrillin family protein [Rikenella microfusus]|uniref:fimbrillin family protein n=1 Tax=Rikenella microfusus TaxID=28139 RepID=UPI00248D5658|nr:fimbrillin family protein [Rikenella microfusus]
MKRMMLLAAVAGAVVVAGLNGCAKKSTERNGGEACRLALTGTAIGLYGNGSMASMSKTGTEALPENLEVGVHVVDLTNGETPSTAAIANRKHVSDGSGALVGADPDNPVILTTGYTYDVYAYAPHVAGVAPAVSSSIPVTHGSDILWAKSSGEKPNAATHTVALTFERKAAQIAFRIVADEASQPDISGATLKVTGFCRDGILDLAAGKVIPGSVDNSVELTETESPVCFLPAEGPMELKVTVTVPSGPNAGTYTGVKREVFAPGKSTVVTVTVIDRNSALGLEAGVVPWENETGSVDVNN